MATAGYSPVQWFQAFPHRYKMLHIKDFVAASKISTSKGLQAARHGIGTRAHRLQADPRCRGQNSGPVLLRVARAAFSGRDSAAGREDRL